MAIRDREELKKAGMEELVDFMMKETDKKKRDEFKAALRKSTQDAKNYIRKNYFPAKKRAEVVEELLRKLPNE